MWSNRCGDGRGKLSQGSKFDELRSEEWVGVN